MPMAGLKASAAAAASAALLQFGAASAEEILAADVLVKNVTLEIVEIVKADKEKGASMDRKFKEFMEKSQGEPVTKPLRDVDLD